MKIDIFSNNECQWWEEPDKELDSDYYVGSEYYIGSAEAEPVELSEEEINILKQVEYNPKEYKVGDIGCLSNSETWVMITHVY